MAGRCIDEDKGTGSGALLAPQMAGSLIRERFCYLSMGLSPDVPADYCHSSEVVCVCVWLGKWGD